MFIPSSAAHSRRTDLFWPDPRRFAFAVARGFGLGLLLIGFALLAKAGAA